MEKIKVSSTNSFAGNEKIFAQISYVHQKEEIVNQTLEVQKQTEKMPEHLKKCVDI